LKTAEKLKYLRRRRGGRWWGEMADGAADLQAIYTESVFKPTASFISKPQAQIDLYI